MLSTGFKIFEELLFPTECQECGLWGSYLCARCLDKIKFNDELGCPVCRKVSILGKACEGCRDQTSLDGVFVSADYHQKIVAKLIQGLKYGHVEKMGEVAGSEYK